MSNFCPSLLRAIVCGRRVSLRFIIVVIFRRSTSTDLLYYYKYFFFYGYIRRAVKPFRYATNVTLLRCACMCATPSPLLVARVTPPLTNQRRIRIYTHKNKHAPSARAHTHTYSNTIPSRPVRFSSPLSTHTHSYTHTHTYTPYPPLATNSASSVTAASSRSLGLEERISPLRLHVLLRTFPNKNHQTDTLLKLISATHVIYYYYVVCYILPLRCGIIITTTWSTQTTEVFFL